MSKSPDALGTLIGTLAAFPPSVVESIDQDAMVRVMAKNAGIPRSALLTKAQVAARRKRSEAAKLGWRRRRRIRVRRSFWGIPQT